MTHRVIQIHLASWRYFALLTLPPLGLAIHLMGSFESQIMLLFFLLTNYYCWRLWLDERLFPLLKDDNDLAAFDETMSQLWSVKIYGHPRFCNTDFDL